MNMVTDAARAGSRAARRRGQVRELARRLRPWLGVTPDSESESESPDHCEQNSTVTNHESLASLRLVPGPRLVTSVGVQ
jgi:hypothetical protein